jgi:FKBP-type peptidyl-prolyl cis-trans isomerase
VISGFDQGVTGMKVGGKRKVTVPPSLGYGIQPNGSIPGNSTLIFDIELVSIAGK